MQAKDVIKAFDSPIWTNIQEAAAYLETEGNQALREALRSALLPSNLSWDEAIRGAIRLKVDVREQEVEPVVYETEAGEVLGGVVHQYDTQVEFRFELDDSAALSQAATCLFQGNIWDSVNVPKTLPWIEPDGGEPNASDFFHNADGEPEWGHPDLYVDHSHPEDSLGSVYDTDTFASGQDASIVLIIAKPEDKESIAARNEAEDETGEFLVEADGLLDEMDAFLTELGIDPAVGEIDETPTTTVALPQSPRVTLLGLAVLCGVDLSETAMDERVNSLLDRSDAEGVLEGMMYRAITSP